MAKLRMEELSSEESAKRSENQVLPNKVLMIEKVSDEYKLLGDQLLNYGNFELMSIQNELIKVPENRRNILEIFFQFSYSFIGK